MTGAAREPRVATRQPSTAAKRAIGLALASLAVAACGPSRQEIAAEQRATLARYCFECHDDASREADLSLESLDVDAVGADAAVWEHVVRKLQAGMMPPTTAARDLRPGGDRGRVVVARERARSRGRRVA